MTDAALSPTSGHPPVPASDGHWLSVERLRAYSIIFLIVYLMISVFWVVKSDGMVDPRGEPLSYDFLAFYTASDLVLAGDIRGLYDFETFAKRQHEIIPHQKSLLLWNYPPSYALIVSPLALLPYIPAFFLWTLSGFAAFLVVIYRILPARTALLVAAAYPATFWNLTHGQNGFLVAALMGAGFLCLEKRPKLAGVFIGLMTFKPQVGVLIPVGLLCSRRWATIAAAGATAVALAGAATLVTGFEGWRLAQMAMGRIMAFAEQGYLAPERLTSLFASARALGVGLESAYAVQIAGGLAVAAVIAKVWLGRAPFAAKAAVLVAGGPLATPYGFDYDLQVLAIAMAFLVKDALARGWLAYEREVLVLAWLAPLVATSLAVGIGFQAGFTGCLALFVIAARRAFSTALERETAARRTSPSIAPSGASAG